LILLCPSVNNIKKLKVNPILTFHFYCFNTLPFTPAPTPAQVAAPTHSPSEHQQRSPSFLQSTNKRSPSPRSPHPPFQSSTTHFHSKLQITLHSRQTFKVVSSRFLIVVLGRGIV